MEADNDGPPIEPVRKKTILKNETPEFVSTSVSNGLLFLEKYGWFVLLGIVVALFIWSKLKPLLRKWKEERDKRIEEENIDPDRIAQRLEKMELQRRRMQEAVNASAAKHAEKMKEMNAQKRKEKIDDWENAQKGRSPRSRSVKPDYNPLTGGSSGSSYRPGRRGNTGGG